MRISIIKSIFIMLLVSTAVTFFYYYMKKYKFIGKIFGGIIVGFIGAIVFNFTLEGFALFFKNTFNVNILSILLGAVIFIKLLHKATPK